MPSHHIALFGTSGGIGSAMLRLLSEKDAMIHAFSRTAPDIKHDRMQYHQIDILDESSIESAAHAVKQEGPLDQIIVATGFLHGDGMMPEKSLKQLSAEHFQHAFAVNTIAPALIAKHFLPLIHRDQRAVFAALSARVGSISDNRLGGWYAYRAAKAALNMVIKNAAIEVGRRYDQAIIVGLHPGTVDTGLSEPFQSHVPNGKLFTPEQSASYLLDVLDGLTPQDSGDCFDWQGKRIEP